MAEARGGDPYYQALLDERIDPQWDRFSWLTLRALVSSANDVIARGAGALVNDRRQRWVAAQRAAGVLDEFPELVVDLTELDEPSFLLIGDTGEADDSQYAVVDPLLNAGSGTDFMLIASDVVYPAGDINEYVNAFYVPYRGYSKPIFAVPGNHDWYDGLEGFMYHFCGAEPLPHVEVDPTSFSLRERLWRRVWRRAAAPNRAFLYHFRSQRPPWSPNPAARHQPGPYYALELRDLLIVCIDTGVTGDLDAEQGAWLRAISQRDKPKLLVTGKPLYVDNDRRPGLISDWVPPPEASDVPLEAPEKHRYVEEVVREPSHGYIAAIGGDVHNYQRYVDPARPDHPLPAFTYLVSGGGGAYLASTHRVQLQPPGDSPRVSQAQVTYPSRADSLCAYALGLVPEVWRSVIRLFAVLAGGIGAVVLVYLVSAGHLSYERGIRNPVIAAGAALVLAIVLRLFGSESWRRGLLILAMFTGGALIVLLGRRVTDGHTWLSVDSSRDVVMTLAQIVIPLAAAAGAAVYARERGDGAPSLLVVALWGCAVGLGLVSALAFVARETDGLVWLQALAALCLLVVIPALALGIDRRIGAFGYPGAAETDASSVPGLPPVPVCQVLNPTDRRARFVHRARGPVLFLFMLLWVLAVAGLWWWSERAAIATLATLAAFLHVPVVLGFAYYMRRSSPNASIWVPLIYAAVLAAMAFVINRVGGDWVLTFLVGLVCLTAIAIALVSAAYLFWMRGFDLIRRADTRTGTLTEDEANAFLDWHAGQLGLAGTAAAPSGRVRLMGKIVIPSSKEVRSPLHQLLSEIFEPKPPMLYKSFLRVDVHDGTVDITCFGVTGESSLAEEVETFTLPLPVAT